REGQVVFVQRLGVDVAVDIVGGGGVGGRHRQPAEVGRGDVRRGEGRLLGGGRGQGAAVGGGLGWGGGGGGGLNARRGRRPAGRKASRAGRGRRAALRVRRLCRGFQLPGRRCRFMESLPMGGGRAPAGAPTERSDDDRLRVRWRLRYG